MSTDDECPICYSTMLIPMKIPTCGHTFCFLCLKSACADQPMPLCPLCRQAVDAKIFDHPSMAGLSVTVKVPKTPKTPKVVKRKKKVVQKVKLEDGGEKLIKVEVDDDTVVKEEPADEAEEPKEADIKYWLYSGGNGWWRYNPTDEIDVATAHRTGNITTELVMCGHTYILDFNTMKQYRKDVPTLKRNIKQVSKAEMEQLKVKGVAGMRIAS